MIRVFQPDDHIAIAKIFTAAIHEIASADYSETQCLAWSAREPNAEHWRKRCLLKRPFVSVHENQISGFLELNPDGHIDCAYINPIFKRRGIMSQLVSHAVKVCSDMNITRVYVEASICAKPMFEKLGFQTLEENIVTIRHVDLLNYKMEYLTEA